MIDSLLLLIVPTLLTLVPGFKDFLIVEHEDLSVMLYAWNNDTTTIGPGGYPDKDDADKGIFKRTRVIWSNGFKEVIRLISICN